MRSLYVLRSRRYIYFVICYCNDFISPCALYSVSFQWPIDTEPPKHKDVGSLMFGILFVPDFAASTLEKGPQADRPEVRAALCVWSGVAVDGEDLWLLGCHVCF